jgi:hypothetical protein
MRPGAGARRWLRIKWRVGRRGSILISFGLAWLVIGTTLLDTRAVTPGGDDLFFEQLPIVIRAWGWIVFGLLAIAAAIAPPGPPDWLGFAALYVMPAIRAVSYLWGWLASLDHQGGYPPGWRAAIFYLIFLAVLITCAGWREPLPPPPQSAYTVPREDEK